MNKTIKSSRTRSKARKPNKKWTDAEASRILDFIIETVDEFEEPTVKAYYSRMVKQAKIDANYSLAKDKVRYMKISYYKAREWYEDRINAGFSKQDVQRKVVSTCREYERLHIIFGESFGRVVTPEPTIIKSDSVEFLNDIENSVSSTFEQAFVDEDDDEVLTADYLTKLTEKQDEPSTSVEDSQPLEKKRKISPTPPSEPNKAIEQSTVSHAEQEITEQPKWILEEEIFDKSLAILKRQLKLESEKFSAEVVCRNIKLELKKLEMVKDNKIKKLEIEKNERIALYEIKEKFNFENDCRSKEFELKKLEMEKDESIKKLEIETSERIAMFEIKMKYK